MLWRTVEKFAARTTIHGPSYIMDRAIVPPFKVLWLFTVILCAGLAMYFTVNSYTDWKADQVNLSASS